MDLSSSSFLGDTNGNHGGSAPLIVDEGTSDSILMSFQDRIFPKRASSRSLMIAFRQLSLMVETGIEVAEALELVASSCQQERLRNAFDEVYEEINQGVSFSRAVKDQEAVLGEEIAASIQAGEASGKMVEVLRQISDRLETELNVQAEVRGAMAYPLVLLTASVLVAATLVWFVLPQFEQSFLSMGVDPPALTSLLMNGSTLIREHVLWFALGMTGMAVGAAMILTNRTFRLAINQAMFVSPVVGTPLRLLEVGRLFTNLGARC